MSQQELFSSAFRERLRSALKGRDQAAIAAACKLSQPTISRWLNGVTEPKLADAATVAKQLGLTIGEMIGEVEPTTSVVREDSLSSHQIRSLEAKLSKKLNDVIREVFKDIKKN